MHVHLVTEYVQATRACCDATSTTTAHSLQLRMEVPTMNIISVQRLHRGHRGTSRIANMHSSGACLKYYCFGTTKAPLPGVRRVRKPAAVLWEPFAVIYQAPASHQGATKGMDATMLRLAACVYMRCVLNTQHHNSTVVCRPTSHSQAVTEGAC